MSERPTISVVIIAHNEEVGIGACIESVLDQTVPPSEVVVVAHNCTDRTAKIAGAYPVRVIEYEGLAGSAYARIRGLSEATSEILACTDGDSIVARNWVEILSDMLQNGAVLAGSWVQVRGTLVSHIASSIHKYESVLLPAEDWLWGASFGLWKKDVPYACESLSRSVEAARTLNIKRNPDDYWLALSMKKIGTVKVTNKTHAIAHSKERSSFERIARDFSSSYNGARVRSYFKKHNHETRVESHA